jgi:hypothetical protein
MWKEIEITGATFPFSHTFSCGGAKLNVGIDLSFDLHIVVSKVTNDL